MEKIKGELLETKPVKLRYLETWNKDNQMIEKSSSRLSMLLMVIFTCIISGFYVFQKSEIDINFILLMLIFLIAGFAPKYLKDFISIKEKLK